MSERNVIVVGGGLSGLCCARTLQRAGHSAHLYEASDGVGGRVRTDVVDGFRLDRGFQVLFTAYPALRQELDFDALDLQGFDPGALVCWHEEAHVVADPARRPFRLLETAFSPLFPGSDKLNVAKLTLLLRRMTPREIFAMPDTTMSAYLHSFGFTDAIIDRFFRPFYAGIFLEKEMETSARMFAFVFKMLAEGKTAVPANGMGAVAQQLADTLVPGTLHLQSPVQELVTRNGRVVGIKLAGGETLEADKVVLATEFDTAAALAGLDLPARWRVSTDVSFALPESLYSEKMIALFPESEGLVNNACQITNIAPSYAPDEQHLLTTTILGRPTLSDAELVKQVKAELGTHFPRANPESWRLLRVYSAKWAQFAQPAGIWENLPETQTGIPGLILAGEITVQSSLHGALVAGQRAAGCAMSVKSRASA